MPRQFQWDETKAEATKQLRGLLFENATKMFLPEANMIVWADGRVTHEYRFCGLGFVDAVLYQVVYCRRENEVRIISFRRAKKSERKAYQEFTETGAETKQRRGKKNTRSFHWKDF